MNKAVPLEEHVNYKIGRDKTNFGCSYSDSKQHPFKKRNKSVNNISTSAVYAPCNFENQEVPNPLSSDNSEQSPDILEGKYSYKTCDPSMIHPDSLNKEELKIIQMEVDLLKQKIRYYNSQLSSNKLTNPFERK